MSLVTPKYRTDYVGETINYYDDNGKSLSYFVKPRDNVFMKSNVTSAIILGNGLTRNYSEIKLLLKTNANKFAEGYKLVYACNRAVSDEETYDYYILKHSVFMAGVRQERKGQIYLPYNIFMTYKDDCNILPYISYFDSGASAAYLSCFDGHKKVFLIGFDGDCGNKWRTVYDGTFPYVDQNLEVQLKASHDYLYNVMSVYKDVEFYRIQMDGQESAEIWQSLPNFHTVTVREAVLAGDF
jgi:hypothetical protein